METFEQARSKIENLEKAWQPFSEKSPRWSPFGDKSPAIDANDIPLITALNDVRLSDSEPMLIDGECKQLLNNIWSDRCENFPLNISHPHFHCFNIKMPNHRRWEKWKEHQDSKRDPTVWWCKGLQDAAAKYSWDDSVVGEFKHLALALQNAVVAADEDHEYRVAATCLVILTWGGVRSRKKGALSRFEKWIISNAAARTLCSELLKATQMLIPQSKSNLGVFDGKKYFMDSSSTKVYAALAMDLSAGMNTPRQDILIYDGRVAASLGLVARYVLASLGHASLPKDLRFPVDNTHSRGSPARRNPSCNNLIFPTFNAAPVTHRRRAEYARLAARYLQAAFGIYAPSTEFVTAEKGLFMIGYDVIQRCNGSPCCA